MQCLLDEWIGKDQLFTSLCLLYSSSTSEHCSQNVRSSRHGLNDEMMDSLATLLDQFIHIGDDTKATARQSLNCINNKKNEIWRKTISVWRMEFLHRAMWHDHDIDFVR